MGVNAISWAFELDEGLDAYEKFILVALADQADDYGITWALNRTLQKKCQCKERKVSLSLQRLEELGLIVQVHRRRKNGSKRSSLFILSGWKTRKMVHRLEDHPALDQLDVEGVEDLDTIIPHIVRVDEQPSERPQKERGKRRTRKSATRTTGGTLPHDRRDPPAPHAGLVPSIEPSKGTYPLTPKPSTLATPIDCIRSGKSYLCTQISAAMARRCIEAGGVTLEQARAVGIQI